MDLQHRALALHTALRQLDCFIYKEIPMNSQKHDLSIEMQSDAVKRLHKKLVRLGFPINEVELARECFGPTSCEVIVAF